MCCKTPGGSKYLVQEAMPEQGEQEQEQEPTEHLPSLPPAQHHPSSLTTVTLLPPPPSQPLLPPSSPHNQLPLKGPNTSLPHSLSTCQGPTLPSLTTLPYPSLPAGRHYSTAPSLPPSRLTRVAQLKVKPGVVQCSAALHTAPSPSLVRNSLLFPRLLPSSLPAFLQEKLSSLLLKSFQGRLDEARERETE